MDVFTQSLLYILLPAALFTLVAGLGIGHLMGKLAKLRQTLERS